MNSLVIIRMIFTIFIFLGVGIQESYAREKYSDPVYSEPVFKDHYTV